MSDHDRQRVAELEHQLALLKEINIELKRDLEVTRSGAKVLIDENARLVTEITTLTAEKKK